MKVKFFNKWQKKKEEEEEEQLSAFCCFFPSNVYISQVLPSLHFLRYLIILKILELLSCPLG